MGRCYQIVLHWVIAALVLVQVPAAWAMVAASPGGLQNFLYNVHENIGVMVLLLALVRLAWRCAHPVPLLILCDVSKLVAVNKPAGEWFKLAHLSLQWLLYVVVLLHLAGALQHHFVREDGALRRMLFASEIPN